jgi:hypothetical protein
MSVICWGCYRENARRICGQHADTVDVQKCRPNAAAACIKSVGGDGAARIVKVAFPAPLVVP